MVIITLRPLNWLGNLMYIIIAFNSQASMRQRSRILRAIKTTNQIYINVKLVGDLVIKI